MSLFTDKVIWITGASSGIGESLAYAFSAEGARLILSSRRTEELERVKKACANPGQVNVLPLDLLDTATLEARTAQAIAAFGHIDIMVHNGGISQRSLAIETRLEIHRQVMELDYFSYVALTNYLLPHFTQRRSGHFVIMSSVMGKLGTPMRSSYAAAKHALHGYFDCLRAEMSSYNVKVTILTPGYIRTNISLHALTKDGTPLGALSGNIEKGLPAGKAARQILHALAKGKFEAYIGKFGMEKIALWLNRFTPGFVIRQASKFSPK
ncbi:MAG TPA: SDR family oxidoreductase [Puia sp.]|nr:SDR family oxidoreductase [Puia sp.]